MTSADLAVTPQKRPMRARVWFWKPQWYWHGWKTLLPVFRGGDEWDWHTVGLGWTVTGRLIIATRRCPGTGKCEAEVEEFGLRPDWPADPYPDLAMEPAPEGGMGSMNRAERRMMKVITSRGGIKRFTVLRSAETGLPTYGRLESADLPSDDLNAGEEGRSDA